jgi:dipeptide/tripeptide permease
MINTAALQPPPSLGNLQMMSQTVFSGADPAMANLVGTEAIVKGTDPPAWSSALASSWFNTATPGNYTIWPFSDSTTPAKATASDPGLFAKVGLAAIAIGLILIGALALILPTVTGSRS